MTSAWSEWSRPVNLGPPINTSFAENHPFLSKDGLSLYLTSDRTGTMGGQDLWVAQRACEDCAWEAPINLGPNINTAFIDAGADVSNDGHYLLFFSNRPGGAGGNDLYVSYRSDTHDDLGWETPQRLGAEANTAEDENAPTFHDNDLYFTRGNNLLNQQNLYVAPARRDGEITGSAVYIAELNHPAANDAAPDVRTDGREIMFQRSAAAGGFGNSDLWVATRPGATGSWSPPVNAGPTLNTPSFEQQANLSFDGRTLLWASNRPDGLGGFDLWMSTRAPIGNEN
jgi:Tol biopolymer transport system component